MSALADAQLERRVRNLPAQLERARARVAQLEAEARRYRMYDLLRDPRLIDEAWEREVLLARIGAAERGQETSMGVDGI